ncbi:ribokinase [Phytohabitans aurantiacus]|jgi:ribokinase|uniref:Ribokinase n=1 Tax=Phytohabitans aurantiacus TaxID=3016789 RepID=A0ABQ5R908_9ACTN|nr:ribokinase [Phytohabitans aurantiacus]GLI03254.1 ribokinase [Phytohabitans aurantiacus]
MRQPRVVVVGSANMDLVATSPVLPRPGETVLGNDFTMVPGGKGANQAIAASRAGASCSFLGAIGSDAFGVTLKARLAASGVDSAHARVVYGSSGVALVVVNAEGENTIVVTPGANGAFAALTDAELATIQGADVLVCQLEIPVETVTQAAVAARAAGVRVLLNAAPARDLPDELLAAVDLLVVNEGEAQAILGGSLDDPAALLSVVPRAVVTLGDEGAWYVSRDGEGTRVPAFKVDTVDSTAAGDAFTGALAVAWGEERDLVDAVRWACAAGAVCARRLGASVSLPTRDEIDALYAST